ncbi:CHAT domain-containing protein [Nostoc sp. FACHB-152]|uniref:CHAT domain-containing protein n=1 Tax=unclassified Nostoc TaxID=2593658 RepID=UPI001689A933|nr:MULTISPECIES: CHAT domain-containing protein [unclassified Nostoc]MBD2448595.1 CHAT domain-containing protein [Nostoc sp. FACHB-152]MBD2469937.1 CHAT domain-containing protein [Nostoc sp. FACHB-145]
MAKKRFVFLSHLETFLRWGRGKVNVHSQISIAKFPRLFEQRQKFSYVILVCLTALLCIFVSPVIARDTTNQGFTASPVANLSQEEEAKNLYTAGRFAEAVTVLQQVLQIYQGNNNTIGQAVVFSNLALNHQQLGQMQAATQAIEKAIAILQKIPKSSQNLPVRAQVWDIKGNLELAQGKAEAALSSWETTASLYQQLKDHNKAILAQINQAQALQTLGLYRREISLLQNLTTDLQKQPDSLVKAASFRNLGEALALAGDVQQAQKHLQQSLEIAQKLRSPDTIATAYLSLGNLAYIPGSSTEQKNTALADYEKAAISSNTATTKIPAQLNRLRLLIELEKWSAAQALYPEIQSQIANLPLGRSAIYAQVNLAQRLLEMRQKFPEPNPETIAKILAVARQQAQQLQDVRSESFVLGNLGHLYELSQQWSIAQDLTKQALNLSESIQAPDIAYRWYWQLGRILCQGKPQCNQQEDLTEATAAYQQAFNTLQNIRGDLIATNKNVQFSFRETVEPVYRRLVDLLLQSSAPSQENLIQARNVIEALQVAKLQNYLQQACEDTKLALDKVIDTQDQTSAVVYAIILNDRLEVILKRPNQPLSHYATPPQQHIGEVVNQLYENLQEEGSYDEVQQDGQQVYNWLIQPIEKELKDSKIKNLIFVLDGPLRKIPMASLYDGQQYLVEKYAVSLALGLQVREPKPLHRETMKVLAASLTEPPNIPEVSGFSRLANVSVEVKEIKKTGLAVNWIADQEFTTKNFNKKLNTSTFEVVHLATHGLFGENRENTFVVTADGKLKIDDFDKLFSNQKQNHKQKIDLLILSACQTATGNDQEVMGIAGTIVQAGASSAIASLWDLDDEASVPFIKELYEHLGQPNISRAEALRLAQQSLLKSDKYNHPRYWAPYVLVGSWL